ncbi:MAG TPA: TetR/AcrR family transcriptional regulator [Polyangiaceae bacterium]|nr:TetR/AcrR family transcriptional regulator [Polyangiaceae bacterium]
MPRPTNTEQRRAEITRAFVKVMAERGYDGASIGDIAREAALTPGLVHYHFSNKRAILLAALEQLVARHVERLDAALATHGADPTRELAEFLDMHLGTGAKADPEALRCWVLLSGEALRDEEVRSAFERSLAEILKRLQVIIERGRAVSVFRCESAMAAAAALFALIQGYFVLAATARETIPRGSAAACARQMAQGLLSVTFPIRVGTPVSRNARAASVARKARTRKVRS